MKYALKIDKREHPSWDAKGDFIDYYKVVTIRTKDGRQKEWKVGLKILDNEKMWEEFRRTVIDVWVNTSEVLL